MEDVSKDLTRSETLLQEAEVALKNDDGRRWPPPPVPPSNPSEWAKDGADLDPQTEDTMKEYALTKLHMLPVLQPDSMFMGRFSDNIAWEIFPAPDRWVDLHRYDSAEEASENCYEYAEYFAECNLMYGMEIEWKLSGCSILVRWSGVSQPQFDSREMTHAQRVAEDCLLQCRPLLLNTYAPIQEKARKLWLLRARIAELGLEETFESEVAFHYLRQVVEPIAKLASYRLRSNMLSKQLYGSPKRRFPLPGYGLYLHTRLVVSYPWWSLRLKPHWLTLRDFVSGRQPESEKDRLRIGEDRVSREIQRWAVFKTAWLAR